MGVLWDQWSDITKSDMFKALPSTHQNAMALDYFNKNYIPKVAPEDVPKYRDSFFKNTFNAPKPSEPFLGAKTSQFLEGATKGGTLGMVGTGTPPPVGFGQKTARLAGEAAGSLPQWMIGEQLAAPIAEKLGGGLLGAIAKNAAIGSAYTGARNVGESPSEAVSHPGAMLGSMATGGALAGALGGAGEALGQASKEAPGALTALKAKFPVLSRILEPKSEPGIPEAKETQGIQETPEAAKPEAPKAEMPKEDFIRPMGLEGKVPGETVQEAAKPEAAKPGAEAGKKIAAQIKSYLPLGQPLPDLNAAPIDLEKESTAAQRFAAQMDRANVPNDLRDSQVKEFIKDPAAIGIDITKQSFDETAEKIFSKNTIKEVNNFIADPKNKLLTAQGNYLLRNKVDKAASDFMFFRDKAGSQDPMLEQINSTNAKLAYDEFQKLNALWKNDSSGTARSLNAMKMHSMSGMSEEERFMHNVMDLSGGPLTAEQMTTVLNEYAKDPALGIKAAAKFLHQTPTDKLFGFYVQNLLSSPSIGWRILMDNTANLAANLGTRVLSPAFDVARSALTGTPRERFFSELKPAMSILSARSEAARAALSFLKTGISPIDVEELNIRANQNEIGGPILGMGRRIVGAAHMFPRTLAIKESLSVQAVREAEMDAAKGLIQKSEIPAQTAKYLEAPTQEMLDASSEAGRRAAYSQKLGPIAAPIKQAIGNIPGMKFLIPFYNISVNRLKQGMEFSPYGFAKAAKLTGGEQSDMLARATIGSGLATGFMLPLATDMMWGNGPVAKTPAEYQTWLAAHGGIRNGFRIPGTREAVSWDKAGAMTIPIKMLANAFDQFKYAGKVPSPNLAAQIAYQMGSALTDESYLKTVSDIFEAGRTMKTGKLASFTQTLPSVAEGFIPLSGALRAGAHAIDVTSPTYSRPLAPMVRETSGRPLNRILADLPIVSTTLPAKLNVFGKPVLRPGGILQPIQHGPIDKVAAAADRWGIKIPLPPKKIGGKEIPEALYREFQRRAGEIARRAVYDALAGGWGNRQTKPMIDSLIKEGYDDLHEEMSDRIGAGQ